MSDHSERTFPPTAKRRRDARKRGDVALSRDVVSLAVLGAGAAALALAWPRLHDAAAAAFANAFAAAARSEVDPRDLGPGAIGAIGDALRALLPFAAVVAGAATLAAFAQVGPLFAIDPLLPKFERLDPTRNLEQRLFSPSAVLALAKAVAVVVLLGVAAWAVVQSRMATLLGLCTAEPSAVAPALRDVVSALCSSVLAAFTAIAVLDLPWQRHRLTRRMYMTRQERKREDRQDQGAPEQRAARKRAHEEVLQAAMLRSVPDGDVCIVNPTHIACVLRYDPGRERAPRLLAKGQGHVAEHIKQAARDCRIPIRRQVPFARALMQLDLDAEIPEELERAAVAAFRWVEVVLAARGRQPRWARRDDDATPPPAARSVRHNQTT